MTFLAKILPTLGLYCVAMALKPQGFRHFFYEDLEQAQAQIDALDAQGHTVYMAQATFDPERIRAAQEHNAALPKILTKEEWKTQRHKERAQENTAYLRNFFLDIDCGEKWPLKDRKEAAAELKKFIAETGLPFPAVVSSGGGLYAHWPIAEDVPSAQWRTLAFILKQVVQAYSPALAGDSSRTSDSASVLRPPGAHNRKPGRDVRRVALLKDCEPVAFLDFARYLHTAAKGKKIDCTALQPPKASSDLNADFYSGTEQGPRPEAALLRQKCPQVARFAEAEGRVEEPRWYAMIGLLSFCGEDEAAADAVIQEWSSGHPDYSAQATAAKIAQFRATGTGPTTCVKFGSIFANGCVGCRHLNKVKSPIVLGRPEPEPVAPAAPEECPVPEGFRRAEDGLHYQEEDRWLRFYDCDLYPTRIAYDASCGYEVTTIRHHLPHEGWSEFTFRSSVIHDPKSFHTTLADNHVKVVGKKEKRAMELYVESYAQRLQRQRRMSQLLCQMGWKQDRDGSPMFVLGRKVFYADGRVDEAELARNIPPAAEGFHSQGDLATWSKATAMLDAPRMEPFAFALLCGFGAPLMKFTGFEGAMVALHGESGIGKTLMLRMAQSIYGYHKTLMMLRDDTYNTIMSRLGVYGTLPLTIDEVTNIDGMDLSDLVYRITQGRDKARLTKSAEEKKNLNGWNTLALVSTNSSLVDRLGGLKHDASAEINRIFEYKTFGNSAFGADETTELYWMLDQNFGVAGEAYVKYLVTHHDQIKAGLDLVRAKIDGDAQVRGEERFWSAVAATAIYGGLVAKKLGLIQFDVSRVFAWAAQTIRNLRSEKVDLVGSAVDMLGQFLDEHAANRLLVKGDCAAGKVVIPLEVPRGPLVIRHEIDHQKLYISRAALRSWMTKRYGNSAKVASELRDLGALKHTSFKKVLGAGTSFGGAQQTCWVIDLTCRALGSVGLTLVKEAEMLEKGAAK